MDNEWRGFEELRETDINISGGFYTKKFAQKNLLGNTEYNEQGTECRYYEQILEPIEVSADEYGKIQWRFAEYISSYDERTFKTSRGIFAVENHGEFGGKITMPNGHVIRGNFIDVLECGDWIYCIDSLSHLSIAHTAVYKISPEFEIEKMDISLESSKEFCPYHVWYNGSIIDNGRVYMLISGYINGADNQKVKGACLYEITDGRITDRIVFAHSFMSITNMIINNGKMILGTDKAVIVTGLTAKEIKAYTPISEEAEMNIKSVISETGLGLS